jgi:hypothetical protein
MEVVSILLTLPKGEGGKMNGVKNCHKMDGQGKATIYKTLF